MLTDIKETYDAKIAELKELGVGKTDVAAVKDQQILGLQELIETLRAEIQALKENQTWLKKDNKFKTDQLNIFLKDCGEKNSQLYSLRKELIEKETELVNKSQEIVALSEQLGQTKINTELSQQHLVEARGQLEYLGGEFHVKSTVQAAFVKERVHDKLGELQQKLQVENSQLKIDLDDALTRLLIAENKTATL